MTFRAAWLVGVVGTPARLGDGDDEFKIFVVVIVPFMSINYYELG